MVGDKQRADNPDELTTRFGRAERQGGEASRSSIRVRVLAKQLRLFQHLTDLLVQLATGISANGGRSRLGTRIERLTATLRERTQTTNQSVSSPRQMSGELTDLRGGAIRCCLSGRESRRSSDRPTHCPERNLNRRRRS
jgi:hypothetical protein